MIILDTNVVSEPVKSNCDTTVLEWFDSQAPENLFFTSIGLAEIYFGIEMLPEGKRKSFLNQEFGEIIELLFEYRILPFDQDSAFEYAKLLSKVRVSGKAISNLDAQLAAIAKCHGFAIATRNVDTFTFLGIPVINPWTQAIS